MPGRGHPHPSLQWSRRLAKDIRRSCLYPFAFRLGFPSELDRLHPFGSMARYCRRRGSTVRARRVSSGVFSGCARFLDRLAPDKVGGAPFGGAARPGFDALLPDPFLGESFVVPHSSFGLGVLRRLRRRLLPGRSRGKQGGGRRRLSFGGRLQTDFLLFALGTGRRGLFAQGFRLPHRLFRFPRQPFGDLLPRLAFRGGPPGGFALGLLLGGGLGVGIFAGQSFFVFPAFAFGPQSRLFGLAGLPGNAALVFFAVALGPGFRLPDLGAFPRGGFRADQRHHVWASRVVGRRLARRRRGPIGMGTTRQQSERENARQRQRMLSGRRADA